MDPSGAAIQQRHCLVGLPATVGLMLLSGPIVTTLFHYGEFSAHDTQMTALSLTTYSSGLLGFIAVKVLAPGFFARQDTKTPVVIGVIAMIANMLLIAAFVVPMLLLELPGAHAALALATALAAYVNAGLLFVYLRRAGVYRPLAGWGTLGTQTVFANAVMAALLWFGVPHAELWTPLSTGARAGQLLLWITAAGVVYFLCLIVSGVKLKELIRLRTS